VILNPNPLPPSPKPTLTRRASLEEKSQKLNQGNPGGKAKSIKLLLSGKFQYNMGLFIELESLRRVLAKEIWQDFPHPEA